MATVKSNWKKPESPKCDKCGTPLELIAIHEGEGWGLYWDEWCEVGAGHFTNMDMQDGLIGDDAWPFVEDVAGAKDFEALGIRVE